ncbi:MAG: SDR family NAD(P)-dependent oxidoreductase [Proteobacteria bacterium]|nr:SDR family NAD(P)-dependent oxidoreductase [Pseudomonadota bacterium]
MSLSLNGRTALVTGGARGIGLELTRQLLARGCRVIVVGQNQTRLATLERDFPGAVISRRADLSSPAEVDALVVDLVRDHPAIDILINNAGVQREMDLFALPPTQATAFARQEIATNLDAIVALTLGLLPVLARHERAAIVTITSGLAIAPKAASPVYGATKAAARSFTRALRYQCSRAAPQVRVSEAIMSLVATDMTAGRGSGKITPAQAAAAVLAGLERGQAEIWVGKAKLLRLVNRLSPAFAARLLR